MHVEGTKIENLDLLTNGMQKCVTHEQGARVDT